MNIQDLETPNRAPDHREIHILPGPTANTKRVVMLAGGKIRDDRTGNLPNILQEIALRYATEMVQDSIFKAMNGPQ